MKRTKAMMTYQFIALVIITFFIGIASFQMFISEQKNTAERANTVATASMKANGGKGLDIQEIYFQNSLDNDYDQTVGYGYIRTKTKPNSENINNKAINIFLNTEKAPKQTYTYNESIDCDDKDASSNHSIYNPLNTNVFGIKQYFSDQPHQINYGDIALLCFRAPYEMSYEEHISLMITIKEGSEFVWEGYLPESLDQESEFVYPRRVI